MTRTDRARELGATIVFGNVTLEQLFLCFGMAGRADFIRGVYEADEKVAFLTAQSAITLAHAMLEELARPEGEPAPAIVPPKRRVKKEPEAAPQDLTTPPDHPGRGLFPAEEIGNPSSSRSEP